MDKEQFDQIKVINDIPNLPYDSFLEIQKDIEQKKISLGAAMDKAREWAMSGMAGNFTLIITTALAFLYLILPVSIIIYFIVKGEYLNILYAVPTFISFLALRPIAMRLGIFFKAIVWIGYGLLLAYIFDLFSIWSLYLGLSIIIPWRINKLVYSIATNKAITFSQQNELSFVTLFKYGVIGIQQSDGSILWFDSLIRQQKQNES